MTGPGSELNGWWRGGLALVGPALRLLFRIRRTGLERIPRTGPAILAANHASALDGIVLAYVVARQRSRPTRYLVAAEFFARRFHGFWLRTFKQIPIRRGTGDSGALDEAEATIRSGAVAGIFPEGTVNFLVDRRLREMAEQTRNFRAEAEKRPAQAAEAEAPKPPAPPEPPPTT